MRAFAATGPVSAILSSPVSLTQQASQMPRIELDRQGAAHLSLMFMNLLPPSRLIALQGLSALLLAAPLARADELEAFLNAKGLLEPQTISRPQASARAAELAVHAMGFIGVPYKWGGNDAETGLDCSGFVRAVYQQMTGVVLPRTSDKQAAATHSIDPQDLAPGDLVFFNTMRQTFSHVGIYIGGGRFVHAPRTGARITLEHLSGNYWRQRFDGARRVALAGGASGIAPLP